MELWIQITLALLALVVSRLISIGFNLRCFFGHCVHIGKDYEVEEIHGKFKVSKEFYDRECCRCGYKETLRAEWNHCI